MQSLAENFLGSYIIELARYVIERAKDHGGTDTKSYVLKHGSENAWVENEYEYQLVELKLLK